MRLAVCLRKYKCVLIGVASPFCENYISKLYKPCAVLSAESQYGHGPLYSSCCDILKALYCIGLFDRSGSHGKGVVSSLEMLVAEYGAAYYRKIGI